LRVNPRDTGRSPSCSRTNSNANSMRVLVKDVIVVQSITHGTARLHAENPQVRIRQNPESALVTAGRARILLFKEIP
jgi:hypothetical protein